MLAIEIKNVSKTYKSKNKTLIKACDNVSFSINKGEIYGLIGPNGAGKSTIIKILIGLIDFDGKVLINGFDVTAERENALVDVGAILEVPDLDKKLTGFENLKYFSLLKGIKDEDRINEVLKSVGLFERKDDKFGKYSLGMRQRLGLAQAIIGGAKILILDEPTNGMDPQWIIQMRQLFKNLSQNLGITILISSHILGELQILCDRFGFILNGQLREEVKKEDLNREKNSLVNKFIITTKTQKELLDILASNQTVEKCIIKDNEFHVETTMDYTDLISYIFSKGIRIESAEIEKRSVENIFMNLVGGDN